MSSTKFLSLTHWNMPVRNHYEAQEHVTSMWSWVIYCPPCRALLNIYINKAQKLQLTDPRHAVNWEYTNVCWSETENTMSCAWFKCKGRHAVTYTVWINFKVTNRVGSEAHSSHTHTSTVCSMKVKTRARTRGDIFKSAHTHTTFFSYLSGFN